MEFYLSKFFSSHLNCLQGDLNSRVRVNWFHVEQLTLSMKLFKVMIQSIWTIVFQVQEKCSVHCYIQYSFKLLSWYLQTKRGRLSPDPQSKKIMQVWLVIMNARKCTTKSARLRRKWSVTSHITRERKYRTH